MGKCESCGEEVGLPFQCSFCNGYFCIKHQLPKGWEAVGGITITAKTWVQIDRTFEVRFDLSPALNSHDKGVYKLRLQSDLENTFTEDNSLTSYSIWYD